MCGEIFAFYFNEFFGSQMFYFTGPELELISVSRVLFHGIFLFFFLHSDCFVLSENVYLVSGFLCC